MVVDLRERDVFLGFMTLAKYGGAISYKHLYTMSNILIKHNSETDGKPVQLAFKRVEEGNINALPKDCLNFWRFLSERQKNSKAQPVSKLQFVVCRRFLLQKNTLCDQ